jgi:hypothetical protein
MKEDIIRNRGGGSAVMVTTPRALANDLEGDVERAPAVSELARRR